MNKAFPIFVLLLAASVNFTACTPSNMEISSTLTPVAVVPNSTPTSPASQPLPKGNIEVLLMWDNRADARLLIRDPHASSLYTDRPFIDGGGRLVSLGNFKCQNTTTTPATYAYWPVDTQMTMGTYEVKVFLDHLCDEERLPNFTLKVNVAGKEVINRIIGAPKHFDPMHYGQSDVFLTTFTVDANGNATAGPFGFFNNTFTTDITSAATSAIEIKYGEAKDGEITAGAPYQLYFFKGLAGDKVTITMKRSAGTILDPSLFLLGVDSKTQLAFNDDNSATSNAPGGPVSPPDSQIKAITIPTDGTYIIVATRYGVELGGAVGKYRLTLTR